MLSTIELLAQSTVRIECDGPKGSSVGTGFFFGLHQQPDQSNIPVIITNKHVVAGATHGRMVMTTKAANGMPDYGKKHTLAFHNFASLWRHHPSPDVDLCAMPIAPILNQAASQGVFMSYSFMGVDLIPSATEIDDMMGLEEVTMVGYPNGLWDSVNNLPIFRRGVLASNLKLDWNGKKVFLIDAACYQGSSGSPVYICDIGGYVTKSGPIIGANRVRLIGILYGIVVKNLQGEVHTITVPTASTQIAVSELPLNLGVIIKASQLLAFEAIFQRPTGGATVQSLPAQQ